jgi:flagellar biosynthesis protein
MKQLISMPSTHAQSAVAIQSEENGAARLTAKGHGAVAERILEIAFASDVKVRQDLALTQMLETFEVDCPIPMPALAAVAAVLEQVYRATSGHGAP